MAEENHLVQERVRKIHDLRQHGINPYPHNFKPTAKSSVLKKEHEKLKPEEHSGVTETVAGRIVLLRRMGKISFSKEELA